MILELVPSEVCMYQISKLENGKAENGVVEPKNTEKIEVGKSVNVFYCFRFVYIQCLFEKYNSLEYGDIFFIFFFCSFSFYHKKLAILYLGMANGASFYVGRLEI